MKKIALTGICCDHNSSFLRGPAEAPAKIRKALQSESMNFFSEKGYDTARIITKDMGDHHIEENEESYLAIEKIAAHHTHKEQALISLGGDHSISYPLIKGFAKTYNPIDILHFDAHPDLYDHYQGNSYSHACPFARIMEEGLARRLVQIGIRTLTPDQSRQAERFGIEIVHMKDVDVSRLVLDFTGPLYVSIDLDVLDPAFAPGVSHHEPGGMSVRDLLTLIHSLHCPIIGADVVEYNPQRDINEMTAMTAAKIVKELAAQIAISS